MMFKLSPSAKGLANIAVDPAFNTFCFIVGDHSYCCRPFVADFLSPLVARLHSLDACLDEYHLNSPDPFNCFDSILAVGRGSDLMLDKRTFPSALAILTELENREFCDQLADTIPSEPTCANVVDVYCGQSALQRSTRVSLAFLARHFSELALPDLRRLSVSDLSAVLSHPDLKLASEANLYEFIDSRIDEEPEAFVLFEFVRFEFLKADVMRQFMAKYPDVPVCLTPAIWNRLSVRLVHEIIGPTTVARGEKSRRFPFSTAAPMGGIVRYLTTRYGGNPHDTGCMKITMKTCPRYSPKVIADQRADTHCQSRNEPDQWICYDFLERVVTIDHYSIQSAGIAHLSSWVIESSVNGETWQIIDRREKNGDLLGAGQVAAFHIENPIASRMIRLRQTGVNHRGDHFLYFAGLEVFGLLTQPEPFGESTSTGPT
jgi:hypothetical protein